MKILLIIIFLLQISVNLSAQIVFPTFEAYVARKNLRHAQDASRALNKASSMTFNFNLEIAKARDDFWKGDLAGDISDEVRERYADLLEKKDLHFLILSIIDGIISNNYGLGSAKKQLDAAQMLAGGKIDDGIHDRALSSYLKWENKILSQYFKENKTLNIDEKLVNEILERDDVLLLYKYYIEIRDLTEAYWKNQYTQKKYERKWDEFMGNTSKYTSPYERKRYYTSLEKLEVQILNNPTIKILNKYEAREIIYGANGSVGVNYDIAPYEEGDVADFPKGLKALVCNFGEGKRPDKKDSVRLTFYNLSEHGDADAKQYYKKIRDNLIADFRKIEEKTVAIKELNKDLQLMVLMMKEGGVWQLTLNNKYGRLDEHLHFYITTRPNAFSNRYQVVIELNEIISN